MYLPKEFEQKMRRLLGEDYDNYSGSFAKGYGQTFRVNQLKIQPAELLRRFAAKPVPWCGYGYYYEGEERLSAHPYYFGGAYYIQEPCAMAPASFLPVKRGDKVLDLCAAPGGKTTALAAKMQGQGILVANDISISRCKALLKNMELAGVRNAVITCESPERLAGRFAGYFDCVLVDAPCSGEGMFRKEPSMAREWSQEEVERYSALQKEIVRQAAQMVRPGGCLLYSTCTYSPEENEQVVETLLAQEGDRGEPGRQEDSRKRTAARQNEQRMFRMEPLPLYPGVDQGHPEWSRSKEESLLHCRRFWNHRVDGEGQFAALLRKEGCRAGAAEENKSGAAAFQAALPPEISFSKKKNNKKSRKGKGGAVRADSAQSAAENREELRQFLSRCSLSVPEERLRFIDERVFLLPEGCPDMNGFRVVRSGLYLGDCKKKRFEPSQALAMALYPGEYENTVKLFPDDPRVEKYLRGETVEAESADGWTLICVDHLSLGWGKSSRGSIKNKIAPGWRKQ